MPKGHGSLNCEEAGMSKRKVDHLVVNRGSRFTPCLAGLERDLLLKAFRHRVKTLLIDQQNDDANKPRLFLGLFAASRSPLSNYPGLYSQNRSISSSSEIFCSAMGIIFAQPSLDTYRFSDFGFTAGRSVMALRI
jgi:hypothetical protein